MLTDQHTFPATYSLLPPQEEGWRQVLIFPTVDIRTDGVSLNKNIASYILWVELASRKLYGLTIKTFTPFISFQLLKKIAHRLESARPEELDTIFGQIATLAGWREARSVGLADIDTIAESLIKFEIVMKRLHIHSGSPYEESIRQAAYHHKTSYVEGLLKFNDNLDTEALKLICNETVLSSDDTVTYNYLIHSVEKLEMYRRQAMQTFPLLRNYFCRISSDFRYQRLKKSVDSGNPLLPALSDFFRCPLPVVRFLAGKDYSLIGEEWAEKLDQLVNILSMLKPAFWPHAEEDWHIFRTSMLPVFSKFGDYKERKYPIPLADCLNNLAKEGYTRIPARLLRNGILLSDITNIPDFERSFYEWSFHVGIERREAGATLWQYSILKVAVLSRRWHDWLMHITEDNEAAAVTRISSSEWNTLIKEPWKSGQFMVVPLDNSEALQSEGVRMMHCVGTYANACAYDGSHIFSIRDRDTGKSLSTVEMRVQENLNNRDEIVVAQHHGYLNSKPSEACEQVLKAFLQYLKKSVTREQFRELSVQRQKRLELWKGSHSDDVWPQTKIDGFRTLLHGYPLLENFGQKNPG